MSTRREQNFSSQRAKDVMAKIEAFMKERGRATSIEIRDLIELSPSQTSNYLSQMVGLNMAHCVARGDRSQGCSGPATWAAGPAPAGHRIEVDTAKRQVIIRTQWEPYHHRMAMECYLFGMPAVLGAA